MVVRNNRSGDVDLVRILARGRFRTVQRDACDLIAADQTVRGERDLCGDLVRVGIRRAVLALRLSVVRVGLIEDRDRQRRLGDGQGSKADDVIIIVRDSSTICVSDPETCRHVAIMIGSDVCTIR